MAIDSGYWETCEQLNLHDTMQPIIRLAMADFATQLEGTIMCCVQNVGVEVDKERLMQALTDARKFYDEGYKAGYHDARMAEVDRDVSHLSHEGQALYHRLLGMMEAY